MDAALQLPDAWTSPDGTRQIPGCTGVREIAGSRIYTIHDEPYLSTSGVLRLSPWGRVDHVPPAALDYGAARGSWVDRACQLVDDGTLDWHSTEWEQRYDGKRMNLRPYVEAYATWRASMACEVVEVEALVLQPFMRTFGYLDRRFTSPSGPRIVVDIKTSAVISDRERLQVSSYLHAGDLGLLLQLTKQGKAVPHWIEDGMAYQARFARLADEAHRWLEQQAAR